MSIRVSTVESDLPMQKVNRDDGIMIALTQTLLSFISQSYGFNCKVSAAQLGEADALVTETACVKRPAAR